MTHPFLSLFLSLLLSSTALSAQELSAPQEEAAPSDKLEDNPQIQVVILDGTDFALDLVRTLNKQQSDNFVVSPYALSAAMAMIFNGTAGKTQRELVKAMRFKPQLWTLNESYLWLADRFAYRPQEYGSDILLSISNALWFQRGVPVKQEYREIVEAFYQMPIRFSNFSLYPGVARSDINSWIRERTKGKISQLFEPKDLPKETRMIGLSATYLRAKWENQFDPRATVAGPYFPTQGKTVIIPTMVKTAVFSYVSTPEFTAVELPYSARQEGSKKLGMVLIVPKEMFGLDQLLQKFTAQSFETMLNLMTPTPVVVSVPKFSITAQYPMRAIFSAMGITSLFDQGADLSEMTDDPSLYLDDIFHRAAMTHDEAGSDAGTPYGFAPTRFDPTALGNPALFSANQPFLFFVIDREARVILFAGKIVLPSLDK